MNNIYKQKKIMNNILVIYFKYQTHLIISWNGIFINNLLNSKKISKILKIYYKIKNILIINKNKFKNMKVKNNNLRK